MAYQYNISVTDPPMEDLKDGGSERRFAVNW